jgi:hypothetical protein
MDPVLGWVVVERQQRVEVLGDLRDGLGPLRAVVDRERLGGDLGVLAVGRVVDLGERSLGAGVR